MPRVKRQERETGRRKRTPFGVQSLKLDIDDETKRRLEAEGKVPVWINDVGNRLQEARNGDYEFEHAAEVGGEVKEDTRIMRRVGTTKFGEATNAYLMSIPKEYYDEDQDLKEEANRATDRAIKGGEPNGPLGIDKNLGTATPSKVDYKP